MQIQYLNSSLLKASDVHRKKKRLKHDREYIEERIRDEERRLAAEEKGLTPSRPYNKTNLAFWLGQLYDLEMREKRQEEGKQEQT